MRALSLHQPWASFMAVSVKLNETRSWSTSHRGDLAICASKQKQPLTDTCSYWLWEHRDKFGVYDDKATSLDIYDALPFGRVVAVVNLHSCLRSQHVEVEYSDQEHDLGDYSAGRWAWMTDCCFRLREPVPVVGRQGLFNLPTDVEQKVRAQI